MVMELLETANSDLSIFVKENEIEITVEDLNERGYECDLKNEELVDSIQEKLEEMANSSFGDYYSYYEFDGFTVIWGYASMDI